MNKKNKFLLLLLILSTFASTALSRKVGSSSMQFLKVMPCARATALGDAYNVWASGAEAIFWNPSGMALTQNNEFSTTFISWIFDARQYAFAYAMPLGNIGAVGAQVQYVDYGAFEEAVVVRPEIKNENEPGLTGRTFQPYAFLVGVTYAKSLTDKFSLGISFKYAHESLYGQKSFTYVIPKVDGSYEQHTVNAYADAFLFDLGIRYNTGFKTVQVGATVQNFGPDFKYAIEKDHAPLQFRVGAAADVIGPNSLLVEDPDNRLGVAFDILQPNDYAQQLHMGMEYEFSRIVAFRLGYKYNYDSEGLTFGGGVKQTISGIRFTIDYSYGSMGEYIGDFGHAHRISLGAELQ